MGTIAQTFIKNFQIHSMHKTLKGLPDAIKISPHLFTEIITTLKHARTFITTRNIMHITGVELYDTLIVDLEDLGKDKI